MTQGRVIEARRHAGKLEWKHKPKPSGMDPPTLLNQAEWIRQLYQAKPFYVENRKAHLGGFAPKPPTYAYVDIRIQGAPGDQLSG